MTWFMTKFNQYYKGKSKSKTIPHEGAQQIERGKRQGLHMSMSCGRPVLCRTGSKSKSVHAH